MGFFDEEHERNYWVDKDGNPTWESEHWWTEVRPCNVGNRVVDIGRFSGNRPKKVAKLGSWPAIGRVEFVVFMCVRVVQCA